MKIIQIFPDGSRVTRGKAGTKKDAARLAETIRAVDKRAIYTTIEVVDSEGSVVFAYPAKRRRKARKPRIARGAAAAGSPASPFDMLFDALA